MSETKPTVVSKIGLAFKVATLNAPFLTAWGWSGRILWPWILGQVELWRKGEPLTSPGTSEQCIALVAILIVPIAWFFAYFSLNVWRELERDEQIYKVTASKLAAFVPTALELSRRRWDAISGWTSQKFALFSFTRSYLRELPRLRGLLDVRNLVMTQANHLELEDVYIELKTASCKAGKLGNSNPLVRELRADRATIWDHLRILKPGVALAIVGAPGSGKTTLLKNVMLKFARNQQWRFRVVSRVPVFLELRKLPKLLGKTDRPLPDVLYRLLRAEGDLETTVARMPKEWLTRLLKQGRCLLLCDGLDEVPDVETRKRVAAWLDQQINHTEWRKNLFLVTARPAGYESAPLSHVQNLEVQSFDWLDTRSFIERWYAANRLITMKPGTAKRTIKDLAKQDADILIGKLRDHARLGVLTSNPLLLTMVCLMHEMGQLPGSRSQLYKEICEVHLERWRRRSGSAERCEKWNAEQKLTVLRPLAHYLMARGEEVVNGKQVDSKRLTTGELLEVCRDSLDHIGVGSDRDDRVAFFMALHNESGLLLQLEPDEWGFAHLSFQEYICADFWFSRPETAPQAEEWAKYFEQSWWREVLLLYASKATDLRPVIRAALLARTARSLSFLFALEGETVSIPADQRHQVDVELNAALMSKEATTFLFAANAWLMRQQDMAYSRVDDNTEVSSWVSQAEYQIFLNEFGAVSFSDLKCWPLHRIGKWFSGDPRSPALGMTFFGAERYCKWLDGRFPEFEHRLPDVGLQDSLRPKPEDQYVCWMEGVELSAPSSRLKASIESRGLKLEIIAGRSTIEHFRRGLSFATEVARVLAVQTYEGCVDINSVILHAIGQVFGEGKWTQEIENAGLEMFDVRVPRNTFLGKRRRYHEARNAMDQFMRLEAEVWQREFAYSEVDRFYVRRFVALLQQDYTKELFVRSAPMKMEDVESFAFKAGRDIKMRRLLVLACVGSILNRDWEPSQVVAMWRCFLCACLRLLVLDGEGRLAPELRSFYSTVVQLGDREIGSASAWEGIRVVRRRRK